jgi:hypothetical protein
LNFVKARAKGRQREFNQTHRKKTASGHAATQSAHTVSPSNATKEEVISK